MPATPVFKNILDSAGNAIKMAMRLSSADTGYRPIHHSEVVTIQATKTRPADTTPYTAGDSVSDASTGGFSFDVGALGIPAGIIVATRMVRDVVTDTSVAFRAMVHDAAPATAIPADNNPHPMLWNNAPSRRGWIDFSNPISGDAAGSNCLEYAGFLSSVQGIPYSAADGILRVGLVTRAAFTPTASANYTIELDIVV